MSSREFNAVPSFVSSQLDLDGPILRQHGSSKTPRVTECGFHMSRFGEFLRRKRREAGFSQARLAQEIGVTNTYIHLLEKGRVDAPTERRCDQLAEVMGIDVDEMRELARRERLAHYVERQGWSSEAPPAEPSHTESYDLDQRERALIRLVRSLDADTRKDFEGMVVMLLRHRPEEEIQECVRAFAGSGRR